MCSALQLVLGLIRGPTSGEDVQLMFDRCTRYIYLCFHSNDKPVESESINRYNVCIYQTSIAHPLH